MNNFLLKPTVLSLNFRCLQCLVKARQRFLLNIEKASNYLNLEVLLFQCLTKTNFIFRVSDGLSPQHSSNATCNRRGVCM